MKCLTCQTDIPDDANFCYKCGAKVKCPNCGYDKLNSETRFCPKCGKEINNIGNYQAKYFEI